MLESVLALTPQSQSGCPNVYLLVLDDFHILHLQVIIFIPKRLVLKVEEPNQFKDYINQTHQSSHGVDQRIVFVSSSPAQGFISSLSTLDVVITDNSNRLHF